MFSYNPYDELPQLPSFTLSSEDFADGEQFKPAQLSPSTGVKGARDISPQLSWSGFPEQTQSFTVSIFDPDAPTASGFWHWVVANIPATVSSLPAGAGNPDSGLLPAGAVSLRHDGGGLGYMGSAPPAGHGVHRYIVVVHALNVPSLEVDENTSPAKLGFMLFSGAAIARAMLTGTFEMK